MVGRMLLVMALSGVIFGVLAIVLSVLFGPVGGFFSIVLAMVGGWAIGWKTAPWVWGE